MMGVTVTADNVSEIKDKLGLRDPQGDIIIVWDRDYNRGYDVMNHKRGGLVTVFGETTRFKDSEQLADVINEALVKHDLAIDLEEVRVNDEKAAYLAQIDAEHQLRRNQVLNS